MRGLLLLMVAGLAAADIPVECHYSDVVGRWTFYETARNGTAAMSCEKMDDGIVHKRDIMLRFPNTAEDEFGNFGTWTMVYDQGFEVTVGGRSYFGFNAFEQNGGNVTSFCHRTIPARARDLTVRNWSCFRGEKAVKAVRTRYDAPRHMLRSAQYSQDVRFVDAINRHQKSWTAALYSQFEGHTLEDIFNIRGGQRVRTTRTQFKKIKADIHTQLRSQMLPKQWDWRNVSAINYVRPVKNQGNCGSCYAFASIGVIESQLLIHSASTDQLDLSAEDIVGCSDLSQGCDGGFPYLIAGRYGQDMGLVSVECVPYEISDVCNKARDSCRHVHTTEYKYVGGYFGACNEEEMMLALVEGGPLAVGIEVKDDFMHYKGGIYHYTGLSDAWNPLEETNHAVLLVGYGVTDEGEKYWIVQNSWGADWGVEGYVYMRRGTDEIAIESLAVQAIAYS